MKCRSILIAAAASLAACSSQSVEGPGNGLVEVGVLIIADSPSLPGWPAGDALRVSVIRDGKPAADAVVSLGGARFEDRGSYHAPISPIALEPDSQLVVVVTAPGFIRSDTLTVPQRAGLVHPAAGADLRGCPDVAVQWTSFFGAGGAWITVIGVDGVPIASGVENDELTATEQSVPFLSPTPARLGVLVLSSPIEPYRPDRALPDVVPAGVHRLAWTELRDVTLDGRNPLEVEEAEPLQVEFVSGDTISVVWAPDTVRVHLLTLTTQFFSEGNLRWEVVSEEGFLPPVSYGTTPQGARACFPPAGAPDPLESGTEYLVEVIGRAHAGMTRGFPAGVGLARGRPARRGGR